MQDDEHKIYVIFSRKRMNPFYPALSCPSCSFLFYRLRTCLKHIIFQRVLLILLYLICFPSHVTVAATDHKPNECHCTKQTETAPCVIVIFGATGDLTARKLLPAIYNLAHEAHIPEHIAVVGFSHRELTHEAFREQMKTAWNKFSRSSDTDFWHLFEQKLFYHQSDFEQDLGYKTLKELLTSIDQQLHTHGNRIYYLATDPNHFSTIIKKLHEHQLIYNPEDANHWSRVIIEKPFGSDLDSAISLHQEVSRYLHESQVYLMDHYLGKEGVQNLLSFRLENALFAPIWNNNFIDHVQIMLSEEIGIGTRASFWENTGALRDLFQNHLMQLLAIIAMEPPMSLNADGVHAEKIKVLNAIRPFSPGEIGRSVIRGQYGPGTVKGTAVTGYKQEIGIPETSVAETFMAAKMFIDNERWKGVPFYIRGGKRLSKQTTEIMVAFKNDNPLCEGSNAIFIRIQPSAGIFFKASLSQSKSIVPVDQSDVCSSMQSLEAYEKLLYDCASGDHSLYVHPEEQLAAWRLLTPVLNFWKSQPEQIEEYAAGTWGPPGADRLIRENGHAWKVLEN